MSKFLLRQATPDDATSIALVHDTSRRKAYAAILGDAQLNAMTLDERTKFWRERIVLSASEDRTIFVATENATICGFIAVEGSRKQNHAEIDRIYVLPDVAGQGLGRELITAGVNHLRDFGFERVRLWVFEKNVAAQGFYRKMGLAPDGAERKLPSFPKELRFAKALEPW